MNNAGGKKTTSNGGAFEKQTKLDEFLLNNKFENKKIKYNKKEYNYLYKKDNEIEIYNFNQQNYKPVLISIFKIREEDIFRKPDDAFIIVHNDKLHFRIVEKKFQECEGSVETKLWGSYQLRDEYRKIFKNKFNTIEYSLILNSFLFDKLCSQIKKYVILKEQFEEYNIKHYNGCDKEYKEIIYKDILKIN